MQEFFEPVITFQLWEKFELLITDGYASYISNKFIQFIRAKKVFCLCLPLHSIYLLQLLDMSVFDPLKQNYKKILAEKSKFSTYNIDKTDFISLIQKARP